MARVLGDKRTMELFSPENDHDVQIEIKFEEGRVRGHNFETKMTHAISQALKDATENGLSRSQIAQQLSEYLNTSITANTLNNWSSAAKPENLPSIVKLYALMKVLGDARLAAVLTDDLEAAVIPRRYLGAVEDAMLSDEIESLLDQKKSAKLRWKSGRG